MKTGIYYNDTTKEITSVTDENISVGSDWCFLTSQAGLGLLAVRSMLVEQGLVNDERIVYWQLPQPRESTPAPILCDIPSTHRAGHNWLERQRLNDSAALYKGLA